MSVHCRACLLLEKDLRELEKSPVPGIIAHGNDGKPLVYYATLSGPPGTVMKKGKFQIGMKFDEFYNDSFPKVIFNTIPFHPNIDVDSGELCVDFHNYFTGCCRNTLKDILIFIQNLLIKPIMDCVANEDAASLFINSPAQYNKAMQYCAKQSALMFDKHSKRYLKMEEVANPLAGCTPVPTNQNRQTQLKLNVASKVSFEQYYDTWSSIATSQPEPLYEETSRAVSGDRTVVKWENYELNSNNNEREVKKTDKQHREKAKPMRSKPPPSAALERVSLMRKVYLQQQLQEEEKDSAAKEGAPLPSAYPSATEAQLVRQSIEEQEADQLIQWVKALDDDFAA